MRSFRRILVGVDFSKCSQNALREASRLAAFEESELRVIHVIQDEMVARFEKLTGLEAPEICLGRNARLERFVVDTLGPQLPAELSCQTFAAHRFVEIMRQVEQFSPGLLVLGQHGDHDAKVCQAGSLASKCVRNAPCQVLITHERHETPYRNIVAAIDFSEHSRRALVEAAEICRSDNARLHIVHVHSPPWIYFMKDKGALQNISRRNAQRYRQNLERDFSDFLQRFDNDFDGFPLEIHSMERSSPAAGILAYMKETNPDLVVLGTLGMTSHQVQLIGSTAERVVSGATCSVLAIKTGGIPYVHSDPAKAT